MKRAIVTGGTRDDVAPIAVFAINIRDTNEELFDELVVFHDGIKEKDQRLINQIFPTRFIKYSYPNQSTNDEVLSYFSSMVFCKYECFKLLEDYDLVVWSDYDVVIQGSLSEFCIVNPGGFNALTSVSTVKEMFYKDIRHEEIKKYNLEATAVGTPLFAIDNTLINHMDIHSWCYDRTGEWDEDLYLPEQCIFSTLVQEFDINVKRYEFSKYACYPTKTVGGEVIIHAAGQPKFWNGLQNDIWNSMYEEWLSIGGRRYNDTLKKLKRKLIFVKTRAVGMRAREHY